MPTRNSLFPATNYSFLRYAVRAAPRTSCLAGKYGLLLRLLRSFCMGALRRIV